MMEAVLPLPIPVMAPVSVPVVAPVLPMVAPPLAEKPAPPRQPGRSAVGDASSWHEVFLNHVQAGAEASMSASVAAGHSVLVLHALSTAVECARLGSEAAAAASRERETRGIDGLVRQPIVSFIGSEGSSLCDALLLRQLALLRSLADGQALTDGLFGEALTTSPSTVVHNPRLAWSEGEPAINVYTAGGRFTPHEDEQSLTLLLNLSQRDAYTGGGTAFWSLKDGGGPGKGPNLLETTPPTELITPAIGTAIVFGGQVTHAAQPILTGERIVFVASFSPTSRAGPKRMRALQAGLRGLQRHAATSAPEGQRAEGQRLERPKQEASAAMGAAKAAFGALSADEQAEFGKFVTRSLKASRAVPGASAAARGLATATNGVRAPPKAAPTSVQDASLTELCAALAGTAAEPEGQLPVYIRSSLSGPPSGTALPFLAHEEDVD